MSFLSRLERSLGWITIGNLPVYIVTAQAILYVWLMIHPGDVFLLRLDPGALIQGGQYWRLLTFLFIPPFTNPIFAFFFLYFLYICGTALENEWGSFRLTVFYLSGAVFALAAGFLVGGAIDGAFYLNESIFLAFAALYPEFQVHLFLIIPVKVKWLAWLAWAHIAFSVFTAPLILKVAIVLSIAHYFLFFGPRHVDAVRAFIRRQRYKRRGGDGW